MNRSRAGKHVSRQTSFAFKRIDLARPFLKWAGGKRQLLPEIRKLFPSEFGTYFEPFVGAGAVLFDLQPPCAVINDTNEELINCYRVIKTNPEELIKLAEEHRRNNSEAYFYGLRALDRGPRFHKLSASERAARILYLNKTCFNGLYRVNKKGQFNAPYGEHGKRPQIVNPEAVRAVSHYLNDARVEIRSGDFSDALAGAGRGDFVYFDPPYDRERKSTAFTGYASGGFGRREQELLKEACDDLTRRGCRVLLSNSPTDFIRELFSNRKCYTVREVSARRSINSDGGGRGKVRELLIFNNYDTGDESQ